MSSLFRDITSAERAGFEPAVAFATPLFESGTINHSDTSPPASIRRGPNRSSVATAAGGSRLDGSDLGLRGVESPAAPEAERRQQREDRHQLSLGGDASHVRVGRPGALANQMDPQGPGMGAEAAAPARPSFVEPSDVRLAPPSDRTRGRPAVSPRLGERGAVAPGTAGYNRSGAIA